MEWLMILATVLSPFFAVQATIVLGRRKEKRDRRLATFHTLMVTRGTGQLTPEHVRALNTIDMEFHGDKRAMRIIEAWRVYRDHLHLPPVRSEAEAAVWHATRDSLLCDLLDAMAKYLGYRDLDKSLIRKGAYVPQHYGDLEAQAAESRRLLLDMLRGERPLPIFPVLVGPGVTNDGEKSRELERGRSEQQKT